MDDEKRDAVDMTDDELGDLLGAYALDAVDDDERALVEDYLRSNPRAAAEVAEHREVATMLAFTGMDAPEDVWSRISAYIDAETPEPRGELAKVVALAPPELGARVEPGTARRRGPVQAWLIGAAAAAALLLAGAAVLTTRDPGPTDHLADAYAQALSADDSTQTSLVAEGSDAVASGVITSTRNGYLDASGLPALADDMTYQLWGVIAETGDVVSIGILGSDPGLEAFTVRSKVDALAITIESEPGVISDGNPVGAYVGTFD